MHLTYHYNGKFQDIPQKFVFPKKITIETCLDIMDNMLPNILRKK